MTVRSVRLVEKRKHDPLLGRERPLQLIQPHGHPQMQPIARCSTRSPSWMLGGHQLQLIAEPGKWQDLDPLFTVRQTMTWSMSKQTYLRRLRISTIRLQFTSGCSFRSEGVTGTPPLR